MLTTIENVMNVRPEVFWQQLFFDADYNDGLYRELGFTRYEVLALSRDPSGVVRRVLRAEPPLSGPAILQKRLAGRIYYTEEGHFDPMRGVWEFANHTSIAAGTTKVSGTIVAEPHPDGLKHVVALDVRVSALGLGGMVERAIERSTRDSYRVATAYTNAFASARGLSALG